MTPDRLYLDANASAPLLAEARAAILGALEAGGNPSSIHAEGRAARGLIEDAREAVAALAGARARDVIFTSGATEAAAMALQPMEGFGPLLIGAGEHPAVVAGHRFGVDASKSIALTSAGGLDLAALEAALAQANGARPLLALQAVNNETGAIQPVAEAAALVHAAGGLVVTDAVQGAGRIDCRLEILGADLAFFSAHKIGGPKGVGALVKRAGLTPAPLVRGGGQERGQRGGTENVPGIAGFGAAARGALERRDAENARLGVLRDALERGLRALAPDVVIFAADAPRVANTSCFSVPGTDAAMALIALDLKGVAVSSGAACSSGKVGPSRVLAAMGVPPELAKGALRVSFGWWNGAGDVERFLQAFAGVGRRKAG